MSLTTRKVDTKARVTLPEAFAGRSVIVETVTAEEVRIRLVKERKRVPSLKRLMAQVTKSKLHGEINSGPSRGAEQ